MRTGDLLAARSFPGPRAHWNVARLRKVQAPRSGVWAARVGGDTGPARQAIPKPQPRPLSARKEAAAEEGAAGVPRARLTCRRARPGLLSSGSGPAGEGADSPILLARRPPGASTQPSPPACRPVLGRRATGAPPTLAPRSFSPFCCPSRVPGLEPGASPPPPSPGRTRREGGD